MPQLGTNLASLQRQRSQQQPQPQQQQQKDPVSVFTSKDLQTVKDVCVQLQTLNAAMWAETRVRAEKDLQDLEAMKEKMLAEDQLKLLEMETIVAIVNPVVRRDILRSQLMGHMNDEKEMSTSLQQHKDEFMQFIWKRRVHAKKEMRSLFANGSGMMCRLGDMISGSTMEGIQLFEQSNTVRLCRDAVRWTMCEAEDLPTLLNKKMGIILPKVPSHIIMKPNRLEFYVDEKAPPFSWSCVYANQGPSTKTLLAKKMLTDMTVQTLDRLLFSHESFEKTSFLCTFAKLLDAIHPTHALQGSVLAFPLYAGTILKKRLVQLGYSISPLSEDVGQIDANFAKGILKQLVHALVHEQRFYYEVSFPDLTAFRIGLVAALQAKENNHNLYPGCDEFSFGFGSTGEIFWKGEAKSYVTFPPSNALFTTVRTIGVVVDLYSGTICLVFDKQILPVAFGKGASNFSPEEQNFQRSIIQSGMLIPMFSIQAQLKDSEYSSQFELQINFGRTQFIYGTVADARSFEFLLQQRNDQQQRGNNVSSYESTIVDHSDGRDRNQEDEERLQMASEKNNLRASLLADAPKSFHIWRRYRGKRERKLLRERQYEAATIIQRVARRKLHGLCFIWIALLRCIYQRPILELHRAAIVIQRKWRHWSMFRNSPIAAKYNAKMEVIETAVNKIIAWWRPLCKKISDKKRMKEKDYAATTIQRVWRGYVLRHILRDDLRVRLTTIGQKIAQHRGELIRIRAAYILQNAWRNFVQKRVRSEKIKTRHSAAARIQAYWKGYWVRSHVHLRFSYGEAVFLIAVCKAFRNCHFLLKMYRPCGIVCPKSTS
ncbi:hypothetical protein BDR26DRAFT_870379 [Obelidium mucronatum]|nr:hypothetical protein BDR26DRAFT_870379 [Obelidium mucronatum]